MKQGTIVFACVSLVVVSCVSTSVESRLVEYRDDRGWKAEGRVTEFTSNGYAIAEAEKRHPVPWKKYYRVGTWRYWYPDGHLRAIVRYDIGEYPECCVAGPCTRRYERLRGRPQLFTEESVVVPLRHAKWSACIRTNCVNCELISRPRYLLPADLAPEWNPGEPDSP